MEKLYIVFDQLPPQNSGGLVATYVSLAELLKDQYEIELISVFDYPKEASKQFPNNKIHVLNNMEIDIRFYRLLSHLKQGHVFKFLWAILSIFVYFLYIPFARRKNRKLIGNNKVIVTCPSAGIFMSNRTKFILEIHTTYEFFWEQSIMSRMQTSLMSKPTLTLFRNKRDTKKCREHHPELNPDYVYNFFDDSNLKPKNKKKNHILFVGRLMPQKNLPRLLKLAEMLKEVKPDFVLDVYGEGLMKEYMETEIEKRGLSNHVFMKGFVNDKSIYSNYELLWLTSTVEGFGLVLIEAAANNIPSISSAWGPAVYEVIENGKTGYICEDDDDFIQKTVLLMEDYELNKKMSINARNNYVQKFSKESAKNRWIEIIDTYNDRRVSKVNWGMTQK